MKTKKIIMAVLMATFCLAANAQHYRNSRYYNPARNGLDYSQRNKVHFNNYSLTPYNYFGIRVGASIANIEEDDYCHSNDKTGLNVGIVTGLAVSRNVPLYLETGLSYTQKGGKYSDEKVNLGYLEVPLTVKYIFSPTRDFTIEPFAGGYLACGVNGKEKTLDYYGETRQSWDAFGDNGAYERFDGGLKAGVGISFDALYAEISYEYGLTNIRKNDRYEEHNNALMLNVGLNF